MLLLLFLNILSWTWVISGRIHHVPLRDLSEHLDNRRLLVSEDIDIMTAGSWDMGKTISEGDIVLWKRVDVKRVGVGDAVLFRNSDNSLTAGRVISIENGNYGIKGDSLGSRTYSVAPADIVGVIVGVLYRR
ncbi:MAG: hypothetical protein QW567_03170 [Candidatus Hadarchaeales archaeon]